MSKLKELEEYAEIASGQAGKVARLVVDAIKEAAIAPGEAVERAPSLGFSNGRRIVE